MRAQRKVFRVEAIGRPDAWSRGSGDCAGSHDEIIAELRALRALVKPQEELAERVVESHRAEIAEARKLKAELDLIQAAIDRTKQEIAALHVTGFEGPEMARVTHELDAIVGGTEGATQRILSAAEAIDQAAHSLVASVKTEQERALAHDTQEHVIRIFEACNFQDLTGQRITKVVATLKFIESHILRMMEIWGGIETFKDIAPAAMAERDGDGRLVNGPKIEGEQGHASQDEIDALFA